MTDRRTFMLGAAALLLPAARSARPLYRPLFDGRGMAGWTSLDDANWRIENGVLVADRGGVSFLVSERSFGDLELRAEFWVSADANSGIFIRCADRTTITAANSYEINIFDQRPDPTYGTGAIVDVAPVSPMPRAGGRWNAMHIRAEGDRLRVTLNGLTTVDVRDARHREGPVALQYGSGVVRFRRVELRIL